MQSNGNGSNIPTIHAALHTRSAATGDAVSNRRVWGIKLGVWVPSFMAMNAKGRTHLPSEDLGVPLRLRRSKDGTVKLKGDGKPSFTVAKSIRDEVVVMQANFIGSLMAEVKDAQASAEEAAGLRVLMLRGHSEPSLTTGLVETLFGEASTLAQGRQPFAEHTYRVEPHDKYGIVPYRLEFPNSIIAIGTTQDQMSQAQVVHEEIRRSLPNEVLIDALARLRSRMEGRHKALVDSVEDLSLQHDFGFPERRCFICRGWARSRTPQVQGSSPA